MKWLYFKITNEDAIAFEHDTHAWPLLINLCENLEHNSIEFVSFFSITQQHNFKWNY